MMNLKNVFRQFTFFIAISLSLSSCSKDSIELDPDNINLEQLMVGRWSVSDIRIYENDKLVSTEDAVVDCISKSELIYKSGFSYEENNAHHWIGGSASAGGCTYVGEGIEAGTWEVINNEIVRIEVKYNNGGTTIREFSPIFIHKKLFVNRTEYPGTEPPSVREVYFSRRN